MNNNHENNGNSELNRKTSPVYTVRFLLKTTDNGWLLHMHMQQHCRCNAEFFLFYFVDEMDKCLAGTWTLRNQGSDYLPGLDEIAGMTFSALLAPDSDCWLGINQKQSFGEVEEISFLFRSVRSETRFFQVGKLNFEKVGKEVILAIVSNTSPSFQECTITRYGPARGQKRYDLYFVVNFLKHIYLKLFFFSKCL